MNVEDGENKHLIAKTERNYGSTVTTTNDDNDRDIDTKDAKLEWKIPPKSRGLSLVLSAGLLITAISAVWLHFGGAPSASFATQQQAQYPCRPCQGSTSSTGIAGIRDTVFARMR